MAPSSVSSDPGRAAILRNTMWTHPARQSSSIIDAEESAGPEDQDLVVADGVFFGRDRSSPSFFAVPPPTRADLEDVAADIALYLYRMWSRLPEATAGLDVAAVPPGRGARPAVRRARATAVCVGGVNLHAGVHLAPADRRGLEYVGGAALDGRAGAWAAWRCRGVRRVRRDVAGRCDAVVSVALGGGEEIGGNGRTVG